MKRLVDMPSHKCEASPFGTWMILSVLALCLAAIGLCGCKSAEERRFEEQVVCLTQAAEEGDVEAQKNLGILYLLGIGVPESGELGFMWLRKAVVQGDQEAKVLQKDFSEIWYEKACWYYFGERGREESPEKAAAYMRLSAEEGCVWAQTFLADMYSLGKGVEESPSEAARWYRKAAEQDYPAAQLELGRLYQQGRGVEKNAEEAMRWYHRAILARNTTDPALYPSGMAELALGEMYLDGDGVKQDFTEAAKWFQAAIEQDYPPDEVYYELGLLYASGKGVPKDLDKAKTLMERTEWYEPAQEWLKAHAEASPEESRGQ